VRRRGSSISPVLLMAVKRYAAVRVSGHAKKNQDVLAPYVYFSVGPASAMGSGRVGCSSYLSICICPFLDHTVYIMFFSPFGHRWFNNIYWLFIFTLVSAVIVARELLGETQLGRRSTGAQHVFCCVVDLFFLVVCTARLVGFLPFVALRTVNATTDPREIMRIWGLGVLRPVMSVIVTCCKDNSIGT